MLFWVGSSLVYLAPMIALRFRPRGAEGARISKNVAGTHVWWKAAALFISERLFLF